MTKEQFERLEDEQVTLVGKIMTKLFLKIKRFFFKKIIGINPEDVRKLLYVQKYLECHNRKSIKSYNEYIKEKFNAKQ